MTHSYIISQNDYFEIVVFAGSEEDMRDTPISEFPEQYITGRGTNADKEEAVKEAAHALFANAAKAGKSLSAYDFYTKEDIIPDDIREGNVYNIEFIIDVQN